MAAATNLLRLLLPVRGIVRHAGPHLLEATLGPTACFLTGRALWGVNGALALALGWTGACMALRQLRGRRMTGLLIVGMTTLILRAGVSLAMHSERAYLIAPALVTVVMGVVYIASAASTKPLLGRVIGDLVPSSWIDTEDPRTARLCRIGSVVWGGEQIVSAVISLAMILRVSTTTYVMVHELVSWTTCLLVVGAFVPFFWSDLRSIWQSRRTSPLLARV
ncbi:MAG: hypothetical protein QOK20_981 [Acidimicrobiaceae bacterium]|jgi:intracellular septation protein A|nr:hypothetical protein [Acidimicrobiaceae bacterium]